MMLRIGRSSVVKPSFVQSRYNWRRVECALVWSASLALLCQFLLVLDEGGFAGRSKDWRPTRKMASARSALVSMASSISERVSSILKGGLASSCH